MHLRCTAAYALAPALRVWCCLVLLRYTLRASLGRCLVRLRFTLLAVRGRCLALGGKRTRRLSYRARGGTGKKVPTRR